MNRIYETVGLRLRRAASVHSNIDGVTGRRGDGAKGQIRKFLPVSPYLCLPIVILFLLCRPSWAATITAASCSQANVQSAVNSATSGDTVTVPGGSCSWSSPVSIPNTKGITLNGGGNTTIYGEVDINANSATTTRVTGFTFGNGTFSNSTHFAVVTDGSSASAPFRIDHNTFSDGPDQAIFIGTYGNAPGLSITIPSRAPPLK